IGVGHHRKQDVAAAAGGEHHHVEFDLGAQGVDGGGVGDVEQAGGHAGDGDVVVRVGGGGGKAILRQRERPPAADAPGSTGPQRLLHSPPDSTLCSSSVLRLATYLTALAALAAAVLRAPVWILVLSGLAVCGWIAIGMMLPASGIFARPFLRAPPGRGRIALTFDDGPDPQ